MHPACRNAGEGRQRGATGGEGPVNLCRNEGYSGASGGGESPEAWPFPDDEERDRKRYAEKTAY